MKYSMIVGLVALLVLAACADKQPDTPGPADDTDGMVDERLAFTECMPEQRGLMCTQQYDPVCASVDTGVRCITEPCPSQQYENRGNACSACSDEKVFGYFPGTCEDMGKDTTTPPEAGGTVLADSEATGKCPAGQASYMSLTGLVCMRQYSEADLRALATCTTAAACEANESCIYPTRSTDGVQFDRTLGLRCAPQEYFNLLLHTSGAVGVDEKGEEYAVIV
jgi:hypothetical protein